MLCDKDVELFVYIVLPGIFLGILEFLRFLEA